MELVETKDTNYLQTFYYDDRADVKEAEMLLSESDSKFVEGYGRRKTFTLENCSDDSSVTSPKDSPEDISEDVPEDVPEDSSEDLSSQNCCNCCSLQ